jgi:hypothetical protein
MYCSHASNRAGGTSFVFFTGSMRRERREKKNSCKQCMNSACVREGRVGESFTKWDLDFDGFFNIL